MTYGTDLTYNGKHVATASKVEKVGINYAVTYSSGYVVLLPASAMTSELCALADD